MEGDKVLVIGSGGREHALGWKIAQSPDVSVVYYAPGNAGTDESKGRNIPIDGSKKENFSKLYDFVNESRINMVVVGPEAPLCDGIVDFFDSRGYHRIFGPSMVASALESDKFISYDLMKSLGIPQADSVKCCSTEDAIREINERTILDRGFGPFGIVIKARGLTGGKGVSVCDSKEQALEEITRHAKEYGESVLVAERLFGQEFSVFGICDGERVSALEIAVQDHKPRDDGDNGPNTGGMGAYCPVPIAPRDVVRGIAEKIMTPIVQRMANMKMPYTGFLYAGMIMTKDGPKVLEFNVRMGDPEIQPAMMMLKSDLYHALSSALDGKLDNVKLEFNPGAACCVVLASQGYPDSKLIKKGLPISGLDAANIMPGVKVFHAGTKYDEGLQRIVTSSGRVLNVTAYSENGLRDSIDQAYRAAACLYLTDSSGQRVEFQKRTDIGAKGLR